MSKRVVRRKRKQSGFVLFLAMLVMVMVVVACTEKELYMQTKDYIEDEAKNKLGLVYPDEIVIKPKESDD